MNVLVQILSASAVAAVLGAIVQGFINKRKLTAEATSIITQAAGGMVANLQTDNGRLRAENLRSSRRLNRFSTAVRKRDRAFELQLELHMAWHAQVAERLREAGIIIPSAPKLELPEVEYEYEDDEDEVPSG